MNLLDGNLDLSKNEHTWIFMSDEQKGLILTFESILPNAENRFCVRHFHKNMKKDGFTGLAIKSTLWGQLRGN